VYFQQTIPTTLEVTWEKVILEIRVILSSKALILEGQDWKVWKDHVKNCAPCHLPSIDGWVNPIVVVVSRGLACILFRHANGGLTMILCDKYSKGWHIRCLSSPLREVLNRKWYVHNTFNENNFQKIHVGLLVCVNNDVWPMPWDFKDIDIDWKWWIARQQLVVGQLAHPALWFTTLSKLLHHERWTWF
jgi:hypothetical protein